MRPAQAIRRSINIVTGEQSSPTAVVLLRLRWESNEVAVSTLSRTVSAVSHRNSALILPKYVEGICFSQLILRISTNKKMIKILIRKREKETEREREAQ